MNRELKNILNDLINMFPELLIRPSTNNLEILILSERAYSIKIITKEEKESLQKYAVSNYEKI